MAFVDAKREKERAQAQVRVLSDELGKLSKMNTMLLIERDRLRDEVSTLRRAIAPEHLQAQIAMLTYENEQLRQRSLNVALYEGEG
jgi:regulator of replication initiation timing